VFEGLVRKHLAPLGVKWNEPEAGMFYWMDLAGTKLAAGKSDAFDTKELIKEKAIAQGVLLIPVCIFF
jgi:DNA-binding transcriptional MocR family regulator